MLVTFSTDAHTDIMMFKEDALASLKMMGHSETVPGAILAGDVPIALEKLKAASQKKQPWRKITHQTKIQKPKNRRLALITALGP